MAMRVCAEDGCPELTTTSRCPTHTRSKDRARGTTTQRGYGYTHQLRRKAWARKVATGKVMCARCHKRISPLETWHLDHTDDRTGYLGPSHEACNTGRHGISPDA